MEIKLEVYRRSAERSDRGAMNVILLGTNLRLKEPLEYLRFLSGREIETGFQASFVIFNGSLLHLGRYHAEILFGFVISCS